MPDKSSELLDLSQPEQIEYLMSLRAQGVKVVAISEQYRVSRSTFYYWLSRYEADHTYENLSSAPHQTQRKVTPEIKSAVLEKHRENPAR